jgi:2,4-dienoyl-CoA reductase-like NADH-dependent reductase (Old Yellow Enzyme family)
MSPALSPLEIGPITFNRFVRSATHDFMSAEDGLSLTGRRFQAARRGEVGLIITGHAISTPPGRRACQIGFTTTNDRRLEPILGASTISTRIFLQSPMPTADC